MTMLRCQGHWIATTKITLTRMGYVWASKTKPKRNFWTTLHFKPPHLLQTYILQRPSSVWRANISIFHHKVSYYDTDVSSTCGSRMAFRLSLSVSIQGTHNCGAHIWRSHKQNVIQTAQSNCDDWATSAWRATNAVLNVECSPLRIMTTNEVTCPAVRD